MNIKMRTVFSLVIVLLAGSTFNVTMSDAQDFSRWDLPEGAEARLGKGIIKSIAYSPDGSRLAVGTSTGIWIYDAATGEELSLLGGHTGVVTSIAYSRDGKMLTSAHNVHGYSRTIFREHYVALWDTATGGLIKKFLYKHKGYYTNPINSVAFSPDGTRIAVGESDGGLLWDVGTGTLISTLAGKRVESITFSPDGSTIAGGHNLVRNSPPLTLWDGATGTFKKGLHPTERWIMSVAYNPDGTFLACATTDGRVILWDVAASLPIDAFVVFEGNTRNVVAYSPDGKTIAVGAARKMSIWDAATGRRRHFLSGHIDTINSIAYSPDSRTVATGSDDGTVRFWNVSTGALKHTITGHTNAVNAVAFSRDGNTLAIGGEYSVNTVGLWDVTTNTLKNSLEIDTTDFGWSYVFSLAYSPDGSTIAGGNYQETYLWDAATHRIRRRLDGSYRSRGLTYSPDGATIAGGVASGTVALSPDGRKLLTPGGGLSGDTMANLWGVTTGKIVKSFTLSENTSGDALLLWDVATPRLIDKFLLAPEDRYVRDIKYSPDGNTVAAAVGSSVYLWDATIGRLKYRLTDDPLAKDHEKFMSVAFSPDGTTLASGGGFFFRKVLLWDVKTGDLKNTLKGHSGAVVSLAYSPDGTVLASGSHDGTVLLWNFAATPAAVERIPADVNSDGTVNIQDLVAVAAAFGETGESPADVTGDGTVNIQDLVAVAAAFGGNVAAPPAAAHLSPETVQHWLTQAQQLSFTDATSQRGIRFLEQLLEALIPKETALLANYPNPFNPETWIPYQLAKPADVTVRIQAVDGTLVQTLSLGHQTTGVYQSRSRAAYWDGKNALGESVASGVYFYTLTAGDFTATRKMLIRK